MKTREMRIEYDIECMPDEARRDMEVELRTVLHKYGWTMWASGADVQDTTAPRLRDMALMHCPDMDCEHWDGHSGCDAEKTRCIK